MKQTAVEWFFQELLNKNSRYDHFTLYLKASEMEMEQIENAYLNGFKKSAQGFNGEHGCDGTDEEISKQINTEQYYNKTYGY
jgi:hypothetical protein